MSVAARSAAWGLRMRNTPGPVMGALGIGAGVPILTQQFPLGDLRLLVEIAWGADLNVGPDTWVWYDVTTDIQTDSGKKVTISPMGKADETTTAQPAGCTFYLDNRIDKYSTSPLSATYPNVRRNVPVRVSIVYQGVRDTRFWGYGTSFTPVWDTTGNYAATAVTANGIMRRLLQGVNPLQGTMRRAALTAASVVAYWPCEDAANSFQAASGIAGGTPMVAQGAITFASYSGFASSAPLPVVGSPGPGGLVGQVPAYAMTNSAQVRFLLHIGSASPPADGTVLCSVATYGSVSRWDVVYRTGGALSVNAFNTLGTQVLTGGAVSFGLLDANVRLSLQLAQTGPDIAWSLNSLAVGGSVGGFGATLSAQTVQGVATVSMMPTSTNATGVAFGHVLVQAIVSDVFELAGAINAFDPEYPYDRLRRLCAEQGLPLSIDTSIVYTMGPQPMDTIVNLLRECETFDMGVLYDGVGPGLAYVSSRDIRDSTASLTLDAAAGDIMPPFAPIDDDQIIRNFVTVTRKTGSSYSAADATGPEGTFVIGGYPDTKTVNSHDDITLPDLAGWRVHVNTPQGYRYPTFTFSLHHAPHLVAAWLATSLFSRIDVLNLNTVRAQHTPGTQSFVLQGYTETFDKFLWEVTANCSQFQPWRVISLAADTGDTNEFLCHLDTGNSTLTTDVPTGASSMTVATNFGPIWTTVADDLPFTIEIGGIQVTVTNITGASSPQTFTVDPTTVLKPFPAGTAVNVWRPPVLAV